MTPHVHAVVLSQETLIISLYPPSRLPPSRPRPHRWWNRGVGGARPPGLKVDPLLKWPQCLTFIRINTFDQFRPQVKFPSPPSAPPFPPSLPPAPPHPPLPPLPSPPAPSSMPHLHWDQYIWSIPPSGKISFCPLSPTPPLPPSPPLPPAFLRRPLPPLPPAPPALPPFHLPGGRQGGRI